MKNKLKRKKLSWKEDKTSIEINCPVNGILKPLDFSRDPILRTGDMGIGFVLDDYESHAVTSPIDGLVVDIFDNGISYVIRTKNGIDVLIKVLANIDTLYGMGIDLKTKINKEIQAGAKLCVIDRETIMERKGLFQVTIVFYRTRWEKETSNRKFDILYDYFNAATPEKTIERNTPIGKIYEVDEKAKLDRWK